MEIGSEFELSFADLEQVGDNIFEYLKEYNTIYMNSGRSATRLLGSMLHGKKILLPSYICDSVIDVFKNKFEICFYDVDKNLNIDVSDLIKKLSCDVDIVYLMHYFGKVQESRALSVIKENKEKWHYTIIEDTTHSIFSNAITIGDYCICSLRKWFPISDGAVLYSKKGLDALKIDDLPRKVAYPKIDAMMMKYNQIHRNVFSNSTYREIFVTEEERINQEVDNYRMSEISELLLRCRSIKALKQKRKSNYNYLRNNLPDNLEPVLDLASDEIPLTLPIYLRDRNCLRKYLIENNIYCAVHWPVNEAELLKKKRIVEMSESMLSLPIDQRYDKEHMDYLISILGNNKGI